MAVDPEKPDPDLGHGPRRLRGVLALLASSASGGVTGMFVYERLTAAPAAGVGWMLAHGWEIGWSGGIAGLFLGVLLSLIVLALDAHRRGPRTLWGWVLIGFHAPVAAFPIMGFLLRGA